MSAITANALLTTTIGVEKKSILRFIQHIPQYQSFRARKAAIHRVHQSRLVEQVMAYNKAIREQIKFLIDQIVAKKMIGDIALSSEHLNADATLVTVLLFMLQSMQ